LLIYGLPYTQVGVKDGPGPCKVKKDLMVIALAPVEDGPSELLLATPAFPNFHILPPSLIGSPEGAIQTSHVIRDLLIELATTDVACLDLFTHLKDLLI